MSETEHYTGNLIPIFSNNTDLETSASLVLRMLNIEFDHIQYASQLNQVLDMDNKYFVYDDVLYLMNREYMDLDGDISRAKSYSTGEIEFELRYYNGGCHFDEALSNALDKLKK